MKRKFSDSDLLHVPFPKSDVYGSISFPVYQTVAYEFDSAEEMEAAFAAKNAEHTYSRVSNPTVKYFEDRIQNITGALSVTALNSGMAAICNTIITLAQAGNNIVVSPHLFGNTYSLLNSTLKPFGIEVRFCDFTNQKEIENAIDSNTCAVYCELISNPQMEVVDLKAISEITKKKKVPFVVDTTLIPFCAFCTKDWGIDIEVVSSTKYISGGATSLGGLILDYGTFDWANSTKLATLSKSVGSVAFTNKLKKEIHRNLGSYMTSQTAFQQNLGLETLSLRYEKAANTCLNLAKQLENFPQIEKVNYPALSCNSFYELSKNQFGKFAGAMFTFDLQSRAACFGFLNKLKIIKRATNLFDNKTLAIHPASTIYGTFSEADRKELHVSDNMIRISTGLEELEHLLDDINQALTGL